MNLMRDLCTGLAILAIGGVIVYLAWNIWVTIAAINILYGLYRKDFGFPAIILLILFGLYWQGII